VVDAAFSLPEGQKTQVISEGIAIQTKANTDLKTSQYRRPRKLVIIV
jgi:hypothetical protein